MYILQNKPIDSANNHIDRSSNILLCFVLLASTMQSVYLHLSIFFSIQLITIQVYALSHIFIHPFFPTSFDWTQSYYRKLSNVTLILFQIPSFWPIRPG